jgi:hypothetical protein
MVNVGLLTTQGFNSEINMIFNDSFSTIMHSLTNQEISLISKEQKLKNKSCKSTEAYLVSVLKNFILDLSVD